MAFSNEVFLLYVQNVQSVLYVQTFFLPRHIENVFLSHIKFWLICLAEWYIILKSKSNWQDLF